ncbi:MAG: hypothetical protein CVU06_13870 [Bacteroidetes bacterium HGW-Bacteroidetes-22]|nr:MAG: hypothetical protein CVU06_13870 [Bacteroidetes bacterium HGW-Bacteroidetes-22]
MCIFVQKNPSIICPILNLTIYVNQSEQFNLPEKLPPDEKFGDNDHKPLKDIYNRLDKLTDSAIERQELARILSEMYDYSRAQFLREELSMKKMNYPEFASHKKLHMVFIYTVAMYNVNFSNGKPPEIREILNFIAQWWNNHILIADIAVEHFNITSKQMVESHTPRY